jgi:hypothetical protein
MTRNVTADAAGRHAVTADPARATATTTDEGDPAGDDPAE